MLSLAFISNLAGGPGFIIVLLIILMFGAKKLPELGRSLGETMREFTKGKDELEDNEKKDDSKKAPPKV